MSTRMIERVYGKQSSADLGRMLERVPALAADTMSNLYGDPSKIDDSVGSVDTANSENPAEIRRANWVPSMNVRSALVIDLGRERKRREFKLLEPPLVSRLLAKAECWQAEIDSGKVRNLTALARREGLSHVYVGHLLRLLRLHPDIRAAIAELPAGTSRRMISERKLRPLVRLPWNQQLTEMGWLVGGGKRA